MNKIKSIKVKQIIDDCYDFSCIGEYTDSPEEWAICRQCGEYLYHAEKPDRILESIESKIYDLEYNQSLLISAEDDDDEKEINRYQKLINVLQSKYDGIEKHNCTMSSNEYNFFKPYAGGEKEGSEDYQKYGKQDFERMEAYNNQEWYAIGIHAEAEILTPNNNGHNRIEYLTSGGLWGIESDSGDEYFNEVAKEELADLKEHLKNFNVDMSNFDELIKDIEIDGI